MFLIARDLSQNGKCAFENRSPGRVAASDTQNPALLLASFYCPAKTKRRTELWLDFQSSLARPGGVLGSVLGAVRGSRAKLAKSYSLAGWIIL